MMAHALGNPFNLAATLEFCRKYDLWLIEDNCDSLGSSYSMPRRLAEKYGFYENSPGLYEGEDQIVRWTGTWGDISTQSFYPPHHLTMGEGGAVNISTDKKLKTISLSMRDWGRDCWCPSGIDDTCNKRYSWKLGDLPEGYDHKYTYSHLGYNLKGLEAQAAIGRVQLKRLPEFIKARKNNWLALRTGLEHHEDVLEFALPTHAKSWSRKEGFEWSAGGCKSDCSWFGFKISLKQDSKIPRSRLVRYLESAKVGNRMLFGGNLIRQPAFSQLMQDRPNAIRIAASLEGSDNIMRNTLFLGTYPGLTADMINQEITLIDKFIKLEKDRI
jgi:CDP-6-deoxy-D-xylo-4-hexulose-3-dehydrase